jgi:hypothetical protein
MPEGSHDGPVLFCFDGSDGSREAMRDRDMFLVDTLDPPIRFTEGGTVGIKRGGL